MACRGLDGPVARLSRRLCVRGDPRHCGRLRARGAGGARSADREVRGRRHAAQHPSPQPLAGGDRTLPDLYRLLGVLRGVQRAHLGHPGGRRRLLVGHQHLPGADHSERHYLQFPDVPVRRPAGGILDLEGRPVLDVLLGPGRHHRRIGRQRPLPSDPGDDHRDRRGRLHVQDAWLGGAPVPDRRRGGRGRGPRLRGGVRGR